jgi:hypothetical protein
MNYILYIVFYALSSLHCNSCRVIYYMHYILCSVYNAFLFSVFLLYALYSIRCILCIVIYALYSMHGLEVLLQQKGDYNAMLSICIWYEGFVQLNVKHQVVVLFHNFHVDAVISIYIYYKLSSIFFSRKPLCLKQRSELYISN